MNRMKYIVFKRGKTEIPIIFPEMATHKEIAQQFSWLVISAGFCVISCYDREVSAYGGSHSLGVQSREIDSSLIKVSMT